MTTDREIVAGILHVQAGEDFKPALTVKLQELIKQLTDAGFNPNITQEEIQKFDIPAVSKKLNDSFEKPALMPSLILKSTFGLTAEQANFVKDENKVRTNFFNALNHISGNLGADAGLQQSAAPVKTQTSPAPVFSAGTSTNELVLKGEPQADYILQSLAAVHQVDGNISTLEQGLQRIVNTNSAIKVGLDHSSWSSLASSVMWSTEGLTTPLSQASKQQQHNWFMSLYNNQGSPEDNVKRLVSQGWGSADANLAISYAYYCHEKQTSFTSFSVLSSLKYQTREVKIAPQQQTSNQPAAPKVATQNTTQTPPAAPAGPSSTATPSTPAGPVNLVKMLADIEAEETAAKDKPSDTDLIKGTSDILKQGFDKLIPEINKKGQDKLGGDGPMGMFGSLLFSFNGIKPLPDGTLNLDDAETQKSMMQVFATIAGPNSPLKFKDPIAEPWKYTKEKGNQILAAIDADPSFLKSFVSKKPDGTDGDTAAMGSELVMFIHSMNVMADKNKLGFMDTGSAPSSAVGMSDFGTTIIGAVLDAVRGLLGSFLSADQMGKIDTMIGSFSERILGVNVIALSGQKPKTAEEISQLSNPETIKANIFDVYKKTYTELKKNNPNLSEADFNAKVKADLPKAIRSFVPDMDPKVIDATVSEALTTKNVDEAANKVATKICNQLPAPKAVQPEAAQPEVVQPESRTATPDANAEIVTQNSGRRGPGQGGPRPLMTHDEIFANTQKINSDRLRADDADPRYGVPDVRLVKVNGAYRAFVNGEDVSVQAGAYYGSGVVPAGPPLGDILEKYSRGSGKTFQELMDGTVRDGLHRDFEAMNDHPKKAPSTFSMIFDPRHILCTEAIRKDQWVVKKPLKLSTVFGVACKEDTCSEKKPDSFKLPTAEKQPEVQAQPQRDVTPAAPQSACKNLDAQGKPTCIIEMKQNGQDIAFKKPATSTPEAGVTLVPQQKFAVAVP